MSTDLERVLDEIKALTPAEIAQLRQRVEELFIARFRQKVREDAEQTLKLSLFGAGLLSEIKTPDRDPESFRAYQPVKVKGKPVSETIIEERG
jgi:hypothetical protein